MQRHQAPIITIRRGLQIPKGNMSLEEVMAEFRRNGRDVDFEHEPGGDMTPSTPDTKRVIYGVIHQQDVTMPRGIVPYQAYSKSTIALCSVSNNFAEWEKSRSRPAPNYRKYTLEYQSRTWDTCSLEGAVLSKKQSTTVIRDSFSARPGVKNHSYQAANLWNLRGNFQSSPSSFNTRRSLGGKAFRPMFVKSTAYPDTYLGCKQTLPAKIMKCQSDGFSSGNEMADDKSEGSYDKENTPIGGQSCGSLSKSNENGQLSERAVSVACRSFSSASEPTGKQRGSLPGDRPPLPAATGKSKTKAADSGRFQGNMSSKMTDGWSHGDKSKSPSQTLTAALMTPPKSASGGDKTKRTSYATVLSPTPSVKTSGQPSGGNRDVNGRTKEAQRLKTRRSRENSQSENRQMECVFCRTNGETPTLYRSHMLKDEVGRTTCPVLQKYACPLCGARGENAHTVKYCPKNSNPPAVATMTTLKSMRSSTGTIRPPCSRKVHPVGRDTRKSLRGSSGCSYD